MDFEPEQLTFFVVNFLYGLSRLQSSWSKKSRWKLHFFKKVSFLILSVLSASEIEQNFLAFPRKNQLGCQNCILSAQSNVFLRKQIFGKICFLSFWDMGQKIMALCQFFFSRFMSKLHFTSLYVQFNTFFRKTYKISFTFWHLTEINFNLSSLKIWRCFQNFNFTCPQENFVEKRRTFWALLTV